jgi:hypothetical protein
MDESRPLLSDEIWEQPVGQASGGTMAACDEATIRPTEAQIRPAVAGGNGEFDDQAATRFSAPRADRGESVPRDHSAGDNA